MQPGQDAPVSPAELGRRALQPATVGHLGAQAQASVQRALQQAVGQASRVPETPPRACDQHHETASRTDEQPRQVRAAEPRGVRGEAEAEPEAEEAATTAATEAAEEVGRRLLGGAGAARHSLGGITCGSEEAFCGTGRGSCVG